LSIAAREANIVGINFRTTAEGGLDARSLSPEATKLKLEWISQAAGARFSDLELSMFVGFAAITDNPQSSAEEIAQGFRKGGFDLTSEQLLATPQSLIGSLDQAVADLQERRERYGISYYLFAEDHIDAFAPVIARLAGK